MKRFTLAFRAVLKSGRKISGRLNLEAKGREAAREKAIDAVVTQYDADKDTVSIESVTKG